MADAAPLDAAVPVRQYVIDAIGRAWQNLASPGASFTGEQRVAIVRAARSAMRGEERADTELSEAEAAATHKVAVAAHEITKTDVDDWSRAGLGAHAYVEIVGVVSRLASVDTTLRGVGAPELELPVGSTNPPTREFAPDAKLRSAFVPTVGSAGAVSALSSVPAEFAAQRDIHALYLTYEQMGDLDIEIDLHRTQMEVVASRTSLLNHCGY